MNEMSTSSNFNFSYAHRITGGRIHGHDAKMKVTINHGLDRDFNKTANIQPIIDLVSQLDQRFFVNWNDPFINGILDGGDLMWFDDNDIIASWVRLSKHYSNETLPIKPLVFKNYNMPVAHYIDTFAWKDDEPKKQFYSSFLFFNFETTKPKLEQHFSWFIKQLYSDLKDPNVIVKIN